MYGNICCHPKLSSDSVSTETNINMMKYTDSNDISIMLSIMFLNGLTSPKYAKYANCNMSNNMTASCPSFWPQIIANAVNMYFLIKLTDKNNLDVFLLARGHSLYNISFIVKLTYSCLMWHHWRTQHWNVVLVMICQTL